MNLSAALSALVEVDSVLPGGPIRERAAACGNLRRVLLREGYLDEDEIIEGLRARGYTVCPPVEPAADEGPDPFPAAIETLLENVALVGQGKRPHHWIGGRGGVDVCWNCGDTRRRDASGAWVYESAIKDPLWPPGDECHGMPDARCNCRTESSDGAAFTINGLCPACGLRPWTVDEILAREG